MYKKLFTGLFPAVLLTFGISMLSNADISHIDSLEPESISSDAETTISWKIYNEDVQDVTSFKIYESPALSEKEFFSNNIKKYRLLATVNSDDISDTEDYKTVYEYDPGHTLKKDKYYRFKIEAYYRDDLITTDYCDNMSSEMYDLYSFEDNRKIGIDKYSFSWDRSGYGKEKFRIYLSEALTGSKDNPRNLSYHKIGEVSAKKGKFTIKGLTPGKKYYYCVVVRKGGKDLYIHYEQIGTLPEIPYDEVADRLHHYDTDYIEVPLTTNGDIDGLVIYRKNSKGKYVKIGKTKETIYRVNYIDKDIKAGRSYKYKARSYTVINGKTYYSDYSDEVTVSPVKTNAKFKISFDANDKRIIKIENSDMKNGIICGWKKTFEEFNVESYEIEQYSLDGINWVDVASRKDIPDLYPGKTIYFRFDCELSKYLDSIETEILYKTGNEYVNEYTLKYDLEENKTEITR